MSHTAEFLIQHGYALLFVWILAEQGALPVPSVPLLLVCGALVRTGDLHPALAAFCGLAACLIADSVWFAIGRIRGKSILGFLCRVALEPDSCVRQTETGFSRYGVRALLVSKFIPGINALTGPLAGSAGVAWPRFLIFDFSGAALWLVAWGAVGYIFSGQLEDVARILGATGVRLFLFIAIVTGGWIGWKYVQRRRFLRKIDMARVTPEEVQALFRGGERPFLVDVRHAGELPEEERVEGAVRIPIEQIHARHREIPRDRDVILFCT
jgi:membrane protein DedA with SNARE-associated domain